MRVGMLVVRRSRNQPASLAQRLADRAIGRIELGIDHRALPAEPAPVLAVLAIALHRKHRLDPVRLAQRKIVLAMVRRHMNKARAAVSRDEIAGKHGARLGEEPAECVHGMAGDGSGEVGAFARPASLLIQWQRSSKRLGATPAPKKCREQRLGHKIPATITDEERILNLRPISQSLVHRDRPRRRRPDHRMSADKCRHIRTFHDLERHVDLGRDDVLVLDFRLGQRGLLHRAPHHRLGPAIKLPALGKLQQFANDGAFRFRVHRQVGMIPIAIDAEPLQLLALHVHPLLGIGAAFGAEFDRRDLVLVLLLLAVLFLDLPLDGQAVAIPAGHIGRVLAEQALRAADHVLEDMVQRMADMHVAIGIGRAIMENELLRARAARPQLLIQPLVLPARKNARLLLGEAGLHREIGLRQEDGRTIVALFSHDRRALALLPGLRNLVHAEARRRGEERQLRAEERRQSASRNQAITASLSRGQIPTPHACASPRLRASA